MSISASDLPAPPPENEEANAARESLETLELLARRRSTKIADFIEPGPSADQIASLIRIAARVPDHGKLAPWRFVIITGDARVRAGEALAHAIKDEPGVDEVRLQFARNHFLRAPACVMVVSTAAPHGKIPEWEQQLSSGAVCFQLLIAAHAAGFAGAWLTEWPAYDARARDALWLQAHERIAGFIYLGTAGKPAMERVRFDPATRIHQL